MNPENTAPELTPEANTTVEHPHHITLKAHKIGDVSLTVMTVILVIICLCVDAYFAPFIILLMSSRIGKSVYIIAKNPSKKEVIKLIIWLALFAKSAASCIQLLTGTA